MSKLSQYKILDDELYEHIDNLDPKVQSEWLFLTPHKDFAGRWYVDALNPSFFLDFEDVIGQYRAVSPASLQNFLSYAEDYGYQVAFTEDPVNILGAWEHLSDPPSFKINSDMAEMLEEKGETVAADCVRRTGLLPYQVQGFNFLRRPELRGGFAMWSTGTGKTALAAALIKQHMEVEKAYDLAFVVVKSNNKADTQLKLEQLGDIESFIIDSYKVEKRLELYDTFATILDASIPLVGITNYEKFREDHEYFLDLIQDRRVLFIFDEMPMKLRNRTTQVYQSVNDILYTCAPKVRWDERRPTEMRSYMLSATPVENGPVDVLNCVRLLDPDVFPTINGWEKQFVQGFNRFSKEPETFKNLDKMGLMLEFMTHQVDKDDPDIARLFPKVREEKVLIDWNPKDRAVYDKFQDLASELAKEAKEDSEVKAFNAFQLIGVLQMLCDAPTMVAKSAENREDFEALLKELSEEEGEELTPYGSEAALKLVRSISVKLIDDRSTKWETLREIIMEKHPNEKIVIFSRLAGYIQPVFEKFFQKWGVTYRIYRGNDKQRQEAKDQFRNDPNIQILLSSDAGSDSIDLPEASVAVDFDLPLKYSTKIQRRNRIHRVNSTFKYVTFYTLMMINSIEQRIAEIIDRKEGFHRSIFKGEIAEEALSARMTADDLMYLLTGEIN